MHESEEKEKAERAQKMKEAFGDTNGQWEKDKAALHDMVLDEKKPAKEKQSGSGKGQKKKTERRAAAGDGAAHQAGKQAAKRQ